MFSAMFFKVKKFDQAINDFRDFINIFDLSFLKFGENVKRRGLRSVGKANNSRAEANLKPPGAKIYAASFFLLLELELPVCSDNIQIAGTRESVVLPHIKYVEREVFRESFVDADAQPIAGKSLQNRIVKNFFRNKQSGLRNDFRDFLFKRQRRSVAK